MALWQSYGSLTVRGYCYMAYLIVLLEAEFITVSNCFNFRQKNTGVYSRCFRVACSETKYSRLSLHYCPVIRRHLCITSHRILCSYESIGVWFHFDQRLPANGLRLFADLVSFIIRPLRGNANLLEETQIH